MQGASCEQEAFRHSDARCPRMDRAQPEHPGSRNGEPGARPDARGIQPCGQGSEVDGSGPPPWGPERGAGSQEAAAYDTGDARLAHLRRPWRRPAP